MPEFIIAVILAAIFGLVWLLYYLLDPWAFATSAIALGIVATITYIWYIAIATGRGYYVRYDNSDSRIGSFFIRLFNPTRQLVGKMPIWIIPDYSFRLREPYSEYEGVTRLEHALHLYENVKNILQKLDWPSHRKQEILRQAYAICENIVIALWKLKDIEQTSYAIKEEFDKNGSNRREVLSLWRQVTSEIDNAIQLLTVLSAQLTKSRVVDTVQVDESINLIERIKESNQELSKITRGSRYVRSASSILWSYTIVFVIVITAFTISSRYVPGYAFAIAVSGSLLGFLAIVILQLRETGKISEGSFVQIITEFIRNIGLTKRGGG